MDAAKFVDEGVAEIREMVGDGKAISALSGGVDSSVVTVLGHKALGDRLRTIFIDDGLMRQGEPEQVRDAFAEIGIPVEVIDARQRFFDALAGITEPEEKRKAFRHTFYQVFGEAVKDSDAQYLLQGTIAADVAETQKGVKTQHNVLEQIGIDSKSGYGFQAIEPVRTLYKPGVRAIARELGLPEAFSERMPFPGPGLATRCLGEVTPERVEIVRQACRIVEEETAQYDPFQAFAVLLADRATGLDKGGHRAFGDIVVVRCVHSEDALTAQPVEIPWPVLEGMRDRILAACPTVTKVLLDLTGKPPSTIEYI
ncbi:MAG: ExsB family transcriptional regulator [Planctomycetota bacterium]